MQIRNATLWDGTGDEPRRAQTIVTEGENISWVGPDASAPQTEGDTIDAAGRWVIPGLIDLHVHITADPLQPDFVGYLYSTSLPEQTLMGAHNARLMLESGFTATRDMGGTGYANVALKRAIDAGRLPGPRMATVGEFVTVHGGHAHFTLRPDVQPHIPNAISGPDEARRMVREQVRRGADWIKVLATGGVMTGGTALGALLWDDDELLAAVGIARRLGKQVAAHCHGAAGMVACAEAGIATIEHGTMGDARAAEAMARHGTVLIPTFSAAAGVVREARAGRLSPAVASQALSIEPSHHNAFRAVVEAGAKVASGSDTGVPGTSFGENAGELVHLVSHGFSPNDALLAATRDAAGVLGWQDHLGTLATGKLADLLLVDGDPIADISILTQRERIHLVVKGAQIATDRRPEC
jgi:imidazolonepropionase-like amidohydrolase